MSRFRVCSTHPWIVSAAIKTKWTLKAMLHEAIFLATCKATMTNKKTFQVAEGVSHVCNFFCNLQRVQQQTRWRTHLEISRERKMSPDWPILTKIALQVAEGMLPASNLSSNVAKSRGSFYFSCNSQRNNCSCKVGCYTWIFLATCNATLQVARKIASCNMALSIFFLPFILVYGKGLTFAFQES